MVNYENYSLGEQRQHNQSVMATVKAWEQELRRTNVALDTLVTSALVGQQGVIRQLQQIVEHNPSEPAFFTKIYLMVVRDKGLEIISDQVFFSAVGDFEENLVTYGIN